jgi:hypothetical protein
MTYVDRKRIRLREIDRMRTAEAKAEELRCRNVIERAGWTVTRVTSRDGSPWYAIFNMAGTHRYGTPAELARIVGRQQQRQENDMSSNSKGGDSRSPLSKRGGTKLETGGSKGGK